MTRDLRHSGMHFFAVRLGGERSDVRLRSQGFRTMLRQAGLMRQIKSFDNRDGTLDCPCSD